VKGQLDYIVKQIKDRELTGHHFYIYFLPFTEIHKKKAEILKKAVQGL
jgi:hypothetical protein